MTFLNRIFAFILTLSVTYSNAQTGCTDYQATNYDPTAVTNDGSCVYPFTTLPLTFKCLIDSALLFESSGIGNQDNNFWTHIDDSDNSIYRIDTLSDSIFQKVTINNSSNYDWEDITTDSTHIYVGDVGNNDGNRTNLRFYKILNSDITPGSTTVDAGRINFSYSDQVDFTVNHNHHYYDCEAFFYMNDSIHMFTKGWVNKWTKHYVLSADTGTHVAQLVDSFDVAGLITSAAIQGDSLVVLLGLNFSGGLSSFVWMFYDFEGSNFFSGNKRRFYLGNPNIIGQAEAICFKDTNMGYITNEELVAPAQIRQFNLNPYLIPPPPPPVMTSSDTNILVSVKACNDTGSVTFTITNSTASNGHNLNVSIGNFPPHVTANPLSDTLAPGDSAIFTLHYGSGSYSSGDYVSNISLLSNDPLNPFQNITLQMFVDSNPCMDYTYLTDTCTGFTNFYSTSINTPTNYYWDFGDGDTASVANPFHSYTSNGNYNVRLIACNSAGCDTVEQNIQAQLRGPKSASCYPNTQAYCCGRGITYFRLTGPGGDAVFKTSNDAIDGYEDFTCSDSGYMITSNPYTVTCITGTTDSEFLKIWLDMNNDGTLDSISEELFSSLDTVPPVHHGTLTIPALPTNVYGVPLRMRVASDYQQIPQPCLNPQSGQHEDYSITVNFSVGQNEHINKNGVDIYPNPFKDFIVISNNSVNSYYYLKIFSLTGKLILNSKVMNDRTLDLSALDTGVYFAELSSDNSIVRIKIIKQ